MEVLLFGKHFSTSVFEAASRKLWVLFAGGVNRIFSEQVVSSGLKSGELSLPLVQIDYPAIMD